MLAKHAAIKMHDLTAAPGTGAQLLNHIRVRAFRHETDVLTVRLGRNRQIELVRQFAHFSLWQIAQREAQIVQLFPRGGEQEVRLVAAGISSAVQLGPVLAICTPNIVAGRQAVRAQIPRRLQQVREFDRLVAPDAGNGGRTRQICISKVFHDLLTELRLVIQHIVRNADLIRYVAGIVDILPRTTGALLLDGGAMIVQLQRDADDIIALRLQHGGHNGTVDTARHGGDNARFRGWFGKSKRVHTAIPGRRQFISHVSLHPG